MGYRQPIELDYFIAADGLTYKFDNGNDKLLMSFTGDGMPPIEFIQEHGPYQHGQTILDYRLAPRIIQFVHRRQGQNRGDYWDIRSELLNVFRPNRQTGGVFCLGKLRKVLRDGTARDIDVAFSKGFAFNARAPDTWDEYSVTDVIQFIAPDPTWYDPTPQTATWTISILAGKIYYSASAPTELKYPYFYGLDVVNGTISVTYLGTWLAYPTIEFTGPLNQPLVTNTSTGEMVGLTYNIAAGEVVTMDLPFGAKSVTNNLGANLIGLATYDLATFHIAPAPEVAGGVNVLTVTGGGGIAGITQIRMSWYVRYIGI